MANFVAQSAYQPTYGTAIGSVSAGSVLAGGWIDLYGSKFSISAAGVIVAVSNGSDFAGQALIRPASENCVNQKIRFRAAYGLTSSNQYLEVGFRHTGSGGTSTGYYYQPGNNIIKFYQNGNGVSNAIVFSSISGAGLNGTTIYDWEITVIQSSPTQTVITVTVFDTTTGNQLYTSSGTDTTAAMQNVSGTMGFSSYQYVCNIAYAVTFNGDNIAPSAATSVFVVGGNPSGISATSTTLQYYATVNGALGAPVGISGFDGSFGGTFSPYITLPAGYGGQYGTFVYTAGNLAGNRALTFTNTGGLTNPVVNQVNLAGLVAAQIAIPMTDANIFKSPGNWDTITNTSFTTLGTTASSAVQSTNDGAYLKVNIGNTSNIAFLLDTTTLSGLNPSPRIMYSLDGGNWVPSNLVFGQTSLVIGSGLANTNHTVELKLENVYGSRFSMVSGTSAAGILRITALRVDTGAVTSTFPNLLSSNMLAFGDSITQGGNSDFTQIFSTPGTNEGGYTGYVSSLAYGLSCEYGQIGFGGQGYEVNVGGTLPYFHSVGNSQQSWDKLGMGRPRSLTGYKYITNMILTNDGIYGSTPAQITADSNDWLSKIRIVSGPNTWLIIVCAPNATRWPTLKAALQTGLNNYKAANPSDTKVLFVDVSSVVPPYQASPGQNSLDGVHPTWVYARHFGSAVSSAIIAATTPKPTPFRQMY